MIDNTPNFQNKNKNRAELCNEYKFLNTIKRLSVMIVDDDPITCKLVSEMMNSLGFSARMASSGGKAVSGFENYPSDFLITDYEMPGMNGLQLGHYIKLNFPETKVVIMTGHWRTSIEEKIAKPGIDAWLFKPFLIEDLSNILLSLSVSVNVRPVIL